MDHKEILQAADELGSNICDLMDKNNASIAESVAITSLAITDVLEAIAITSNIDFKTLMDDFHQSCDTLHNKVYVGNIPNIN